MNVVIGCRCNNEVVVLTLYFIWKLIRLISVPWEFSSQSLAGPFFGLQCLSFSMVGIV